jgi:hypothetical protein
MKTIRNIFGKCWISHISPGKVVTKMLENWDFSQVAEGLGVTQLAQGWGGKEAGKLGLGVKICMRWHSTRTHAYIYFYYCIILYYMILNDVKYITILYIYLFNIIYIIYTV